MNNLIAKDHTATAQSAQIIPLILSEAGGQKAKPFSDNLDHLQALEREVRLLLLVSLLRKNGKETGNNKELATALSYLGTSTEEASLEWALQSLEETGRINREREADSQRAGSHLRVPNFAETYGLDYFERNVVLILLMLSTSRSFSEMYFACDFEEERRRNAGMQVGSLLSILCADYREQLAARTYFSVDGRLIREEILVFQGYLDNTTNILDETVCLHERIVRFLIGDNNLYHSTFNYIKREKVHIRLDQVILPDAIKEEVVGHVSSFFAGKRGEGSRKLDDFYGYGTGMAFLFYGPSGTGKTMLAQALASHFDRQIFALKAVDMNRIPESYEDILATVFREASLHEGIVFFDESDDIFANDTSASRALLVELEKSRCITILATNKAVDLDPSLERRIGMKVCFSMPDSDLRRRMWQALIPPYVELAPDVDLREFADRYLFSGGLIKNTIFMAINSTRKEGDTKPFVTRDSLERMAILQSMKISDATGLYRLYSPQQTVAEIEIHREQKDELKGIARAYGQLQEQGLGFNLLLSSSDIPSGMKVVEALAAECGLKVREFNLDRVLSLSDDNRILDPMSQRKVRPLQFAFSQATVDKALTLFVDHEGQIATILNSTKDSEKATGGIGLAELLGMLREHDGLFCLVTKTIARKMLPLEFNLHMELRYPPREVQKNEWAAHLPSVAGDERGVDSIVTQWPMHVEEIRFVARQATIQAIIRGTCGLSMLPEIMDVIARYRQKAGMPVLFGGS